MRAFQITSFQYAEDKLYETVLDGKLVETEKGLVFVIFDALMVDGKSMLFGWLQTRLNYVEPILPLLNQFSEMSFEIATLYLLEDAQYVANELPSKLLFKTNGLLFLPSDNIYHCGFQHNHLKWKELDQKRVDFKLDKILNGETVEKYNLNVDDGFHSSIVPLGHELDGVSSGQIIECYWDNSSGAWKLTRIRQDKHQPNIRAIADKIQAAGKHHITLDHLFTKKWDKI